MVTEPQTCEASSQPCPRDSDGELPLGGAAQDVVVGLLARLPRHRALPWPGPGRGRPTVHVEPDRRAAVSTRRTWVWSVTADCQRIIEETKCLKLGFKSIDGRSPAVVGQVGMLGTEDGPLAGSYDLPGQVTGPGPAQLLQ